jgi:hypothetical protein
MTATAMRGASATLSVPSGSNANISGSTAGIVSGSTTINQQTASSPNGQPL